METAVSSEMSRSPAVSSLIALTTRLPELPHHASIVSTTRPSSPLVALSQPAVVSSHPPVHVLRVTPRPVDTITPAVKPTSTITIPTVLGSQPSFMPSTPASRFRPPSSTVTNLQAAFNRGAFSSTTGPSLHQLLSSSATSAVHSTKSRLPFSSSSPNLLATGNKHVLVDNSTGQVITTLLPPAGSGRRLDDAKLRKNSSISSGIASVSARRCIVYCIFVYGMQKQKACM